MQDLGPEQATPQEGLPGTGLVAAGLAATAQGANGWPLRGSGGGDGGGGNRLASVALAAMAAAVRQKQEQQQQQQGTAPAVSGRAAGHAAARSSPSLAHAPFRPRNWRLSSDGETGSAAAAGAGVGAGPGAGGRLPRTVSHAVTKLRLQAGELLSQLQVKGGGEGGRGGGSGWQWGEEEDSWDLDKVGAEAK